MLRRVITLAMGGILLTATPAGGQNAETPYWATIDVTEANMRVGPSAEYKIDWVYKRKGLPVKVLRVREGWRLVEDPDGDKGWIAARLLSRTRGGFVTGDGLAEMHESERAGSAVKWKLQPGVVGALGACADNWCEFSVGKRSGFVEQNRLWGAGEP
ncbi:SH3 domain-containing protein [Citromicrobium bathyomarinum]|uniref:SH3 domain-containing protein n=1 Tax=Citromicrobium bathyomarinum TaxID=72174 RepID=UPI00315B13A2